MPYAIREQKNARTDDAEYVVVDGSGTPVPPPNTFRTKAEAEARRAELEELELIAHWKATAPKPRQRCIGEVVAATPTVLIQHLGLGTYTFHRRRDSEDLAEVDVGDTIDVTDGQVREPEPKRSRDSGLHM
jgi:hypothetical protein